MSQIIFAIGIFPIVFRKKSSSIVSAETFLNVGNNSNSFPKRNGCPGCNACICLFKDNCVSSWMAAIFAVSVKTFCSACDEPLFDVDELDGLSNCVLNNIIARKQLYSWWSNWYKRTFANISWNSLTFCKNIVELLWSLRSKMPQACTSEESSTNGKNCAAPNTNNSLQLSSNSNNWSENGSDVNEDILLAHCTLVKSNLAAYSQIAVGLSNDGGIIGDKGTTEGNCKPKKKEIKTTFKELPSIC